MAAIPAGGKFGSTVKEKFKSLESELVTEHDDEVRRLSEENAELRRRVDTVFVALQPPGGLECVDDAQCHALCASPWANILRSKPVALPVTDGEVQRTYWVHAVILDVIPHLQASRTRWCTDPFDQVEIQHLPARCSHVALGVLLCRLYSPCPWPEQKWGALGPTTILETTLLADMWDLADVAEEAGAALRLTATTKGTFLAIRQCLDAISPPRSLAAFVGHRPAVSTMSDTDVCQMVVSVATTANEKAQLVANDILETWQLYGSAIDGPLCNALRSEDLISVSEKHFQKMGEHYEGTTKFKSIAGFVWLCTLLEAHAKARPGCLVDMLSALECAANNLKVSRYKGYRAEYTPDAPSLKAVSHHIQTLLDIGSNHADAGDLSKDVLGQVALRHVSAVPGSVIAAVTDEFQQRFVNACSGVEWYNHARLQALRGCARVSAIRKLAVKLGELSDDAAEFVGTELCMHAATNE